MTNTIQNRVSNYAEHVLVQSNIVNNPYFTDLSNSKMSREKFIASQAQFYFAVSFFFRPMCILLARVLNTKARMAILKNIIEEHGEMQEGKFHENTFKDFLSLLDYSADDFKCLEMGSGVKNFIDTVTITCQEKPIETAIACMGMIERAFADLARIIAKGVIKNHWLTKEKLIHYNLHEQLDIEHAADFFGIIEPSWALPHKQELIKEGLTLGINVTCPVF